MSLAAFFSICLGFIAVIQGGLNRQISSKLGLVWAILINNSVIFIAGILFYFFVKYNPDIFSTFFKEKGTFSHLSWWYIIPGLCGLCLVAGIPLAINKIGALNVFIAIVAGQMILSIIWDFYVEGIAISPIRITSAVLSLISVLLLSWKSA